MKLLIALFLLLSLVAVSAYAFNIIDRFIYRQDVLRSNNAPVMVNRFTGEVKYVLRGDGEWVELEGEWKQEYQNMYDAQTAGAIR